MAHINDVNDLFGTQIWMARKTCYRRNLSLPWCQWKTTDDLLWETNLLEKGFEKWKQHNHLVMSCPWNSTESTTSANFMFLVSAKKIWEGACDTYSTKKNASQVLGVWKHVCQGNMSWEDYYCKIKDMTNEHIQHPFISGEFFG